MKKKSFAYLFIICILLFLVGATAIFILYSQKKSTGPEEGVPESSQKTDPCASLPKETKIVLGNSLSGILENGETISVILGYYDCYEVKREDIVIYQYAETREPVIKIVKGLAGDEFHLEKENSGWHILINKEILKNSQGLPYLLGEQGYRMLSLYEKDYKGVIPENAYLILGNTPGGSFDSTRFGLVDKSDFLGKAE